MRWLKTGNGYRSECGRFELQRTGAPSKGRWVLFDNARRDPHVPEFSWSVYCPSVTSAKRQAARIASALPRG